MAYHKHRPTSALMGVGTIILVGGPLWQSQRGTN